MEWKGTYVLTSAIPQFDQLLGLPKASKYTLMKFHAAADKQTSTLFSYKRKLVDYSTTVCLTLLCWQFSSLDKNPMHTQKLGLSTNIHKVI